MEKEMLLLDADKKQSQGLCRFLLDQSYKTTRVPSLEDMDRFVRKKDYLAILVDLDTVEINNRVLRDLKKNNPGTKIITLSKRKFHPELDEALEAYISVCLIKPVDYEELIYWLDSIAKNHETSGE